MDSGRWTTEVVGRVSEWIDLDSPSEYVRINSKKVIRQELAWASHLGVPAVLLPPPTYYSNNYAAVINSTLSQSYFTLWLRIPLVSPQRASPDFQGKASSSSDRCIDDSWEWWNNFRTACEYHPNLAVALELSADLPSQAALDRWFAEPVKAVFVPTSIFLTNKKGFPVLSKAHQSCIQKLFLLNAQLVVTGPPSQGQGLGIYWQYLQYLHRNMKPLTPEEQFESPYFDYLQAPLQPLMDNLESQTYETFERDPVKYKLYEEAVYLALLDHARDSRPTVVMVVGAGRGPLVRASLRASERAEKPIRVYAVEKNPNAVVTLRNLKNDLKWGDQVTIVDCDMRRWEAPEKADILVSELLGSFSDNELSPECLDGAQRFLADDGISIPCEYTSFISPVTNTKVWNEVKAYNDLKHFETPFVVRLHAQNVLAPAQPCFTFVHPNYESPIDNTRYKMAAFQCRKAALLHGVAGYFDCTLYKDVHISINPATYTEHMISWFPIFFPLRNPIYCPAGSEIVLHFWRNATTAKVWYEWSVSEPQTAVIHNPNGRSYWIGL